MKKFPALLIFGLVPVFAFFAWNPGPGTTQVDRTQDLVYGRKCGTALTMDVFVPPKKNGAAVVWIVSGGYISGHDAIRPDHYAPLLERGYTVFAVVHGAQPRFVIPEIQEDVHRAVRFIRHHAVRWGVNPDRIGVTGGSSGGHLSLTLGTQGKPGPADAGDRVDRESSAVQAVACFFPPTDFLNASKPDEDWMDFAATRPFEPAFGPAGMSRDQRHVLGRQLSPLRFVTAKMAPTLVIHGDADTLVPLYQARLFEQKCKEVGAPFTLIVKPGAGHDYPGWEKDLPAVVAWFDRHLLGVENPPRSQF